MQKKDLKNIVLFLNGDRGVAVFNALCDAGYNFSAIVTPPNVTLNPSNFVPEYKYCTHLELSNVNNPKSIDILSSFEPSVFIVAGFSSIFGAELLSVPSYGTLNLHAGRLPEYRGGSPLNWQLINGELYAGISVIKADLGIDTGHVLAEALIPITERSTIAELHNKANSLFPKLVMDALCCIRNKDAGRVQTEEYARYWHQRSDADGRLSFQNMTAIQIDRMVRALAKPYQGAWCTYNDKVLRVFSVEVPKFVLMGVPGRVCFIQGVGPYVVCSDSAVLLSEYHIENGGVTKLRHGDHL